MQKKYYNLRSMSFEDCMMYIWYMLQGIKELHILKIYLFFIVETRVEPEDAHTDLVHGTRLYVQQ